MVSATLATRAVHSDVQRFLERHGAEDAFATVCRLLRECHPQLENIEAELRDDPDDSARRKVVIWFTLPSSLATELYLAQHETYHDRLIHEIPLSLLPLFGVLAKFDGD